jgi:hypothetical protein
MATFSPFGLISCDTRTSAPWNSKANQTYQINPTDNTPIYVGDPVTVVNGYVTKYTSDNQPGGGNVLPILGVFLGCNYNQVGTGYNVPFFRAWLGVNDVVSGTPVYAVVEDNIDTIFKVQSGNALGVQIGSTYQNALLNIPAPLTPSNNPNQTSNVSIQDSTAGNANYDMKVVGIFDAANGGAYNATPTLNQWSTNTLICPYPILLVQFNQHVTRAGTAGLA